jgi:hypothetical protein
MEDKEIIGLQSQHIRVLQDRVETLSLHVAEQNVLLDEMIEGAQTYMRWKLYRQVFAYVVVAVLAMFGVVHYLTAPAVTVIERCTKFKGLGFETEICNTTSWLSIIMVIVMVVGTYAGVKLVDRMKHK